MAKRLPLPRIEYDIHEKDCKLVNELHRFDGIELSVKSAETWRPYTPTADYVITDRVGRKWGIERKSFVDCINSIRSKRIYGQLAQLIEAYQDRAVLLIEEPTYIPRQLARTNEEAWALREAVMTFANEQAAMLIVWRGTTPKYTARFMVKWARSAHLRKNRGRGIVISLENGLGDNVEVC